MTTHEDLTVRRHVDAPPERVWAVLTDVRNAPNVLRGVTRVDVLTDGPYAVGARWRETRRMLGKEGTEEMWVVAADPVRSTVVAASSRGTDYRTTFDLAATDGGTELAVTFAATAPERSGLTGRVWSLLARVGAAATRKALERDLEDIAAAAERG